VPFVFIGPRDNAGPLEPFAQAAGEEALALRLGVGRVVDGWLATYAAGDDAAQELAAAIPTRCSTSTRRTASARPSTCARSAARAVTLECGQHDDPRAVDVAHRAIVNTLAHLGLIDAADPAPAARVERSACARSSTGPARRRVRQGHGRGFDRVAAGERIGTRADGTAIDAPFDASSSFPNASALAGQSGSTSPARARAGERRQRRASARRAPRSRRR
jgi:hypothetical protein